MYGTLFQRNFHRLVGKIVSLFSSSLVLILSLRTILCHFLKRIKTIHSNTHKRNGKVIKNNLSFWLRWHFFFQQIELRFLDAYDAVQSGVSAQQLKPSTNFAMIFFQFRLKSHAVCFVLFIQQARKRCKLAGNQSIVQLVK